LFPSGGCIEQGFEFNQLEGDTALLFLHSVFSFYFSTATPKSIQGSFGQIAGKPVIISLP
jgi:hypothetical protein